MTRRHARVRVAACVAFALAAGCTASEPQRGPAAHDDGLQLTGTLAGRQVSVSDGQPEVVSGDCDPLDGADVDLCVIARTIDGETLGLAFDNPVALFAGTRLDVERPSCTPAVCDDVADVAHVDVRRGEERHVAVGGELRVTEATDRHAGSFQLEFADGGTLSGSYNVAVVGTP